MSLDENKIKRELFEKGLKSYNEREFYAAHEYWEDLWSDYVLPDAKFIQALIQLSVGYFHITNSNINGANGLLKKCVPKFEMYLPTKRGIDVGEILTQVNASLENLKLIDNINDFDWGLVKKIKINNE